MQKTWFCMGQQDESFFFRVFCSEIATAHFRTVSTNLVRGLYYLYMARRQRGFTPPPRLVSDHAPA